MARRHDDCFLLWTYVLAFHAVFPSTVEASPLLSQDNWRLIGLRTDGEEGPLLQALDEIEFVAAGENEPQTIFSMFEFRTGDSYRAEDDSGWLLHAGFFPCTDTTEWIYSLEHGELDDEAVTAGSLTITDTSATCPGCSKPIESATNCWGAPDNEEAKNWTMTFVNAM